MKTTATASMRGEFQWPKLASCDENPPRLTVEHMWQNAMPRGGGGAGSGAGHASASSSSAKVDATSTMGTEAPSWRSICACEITPRMRAGASTLAASTTSR